MIQIPAKALTVWQYVLSHPFTWAILGVVAGDIAGHFHWPV